MRRLITGLPETASQAFSSELVRGCSRGFFCRRERVRGPSPSLVGWRPERRIERPEVKSSQPILRPPNEVRRARVIHHNHPSGCIDFAPFKYCPMDSLGKALVVAGIALAVVGAILWLLGRGGGAWLPGDIVVEKRHVKVYFPIVTCLVISLALSVIAWLFRR